MVTLVCIIMVPVGGYIIMVTFRCTIMLVTVPITDYRQTKVCCTWHIRIIVSTGWIIYLYILFRMRGELGDYLIMIFDDGVFMMMNGNVERDDVGHDEVGHDEVGRNDVWF